MARAKQAYNDGMVELDFQGGELVWSNLDGKGPDTYVPGTTVPAPRSIRYTGLGTLHDGTGVDLEISSLLAYQPQKDERNGYDKTKTAPFGNVNMQSPMEVNTGMFVDLKFEFKKSRSNDLLVLPKTLLSFYDFDMDFNEGIRECGQFRGVVGEPKLSDETEPLHTPTELIPLVVTPTKAGLRAAQPDSAKADLAEHLFTTSEYGPIKLEDPQLAAWDSSIDGVTKMYCASTSGVGSDNPGSYRRLTPLQRSRMVMVTIKDRSSFDVRYVLNTAASKPCRQSNSCNRLATGRNFLFAGNSDPPLVICAPPSPPPDGSSDGPTRDDDEEEEDFRENCNSDCASNPKGWGNKCKWNGCKGCSQCDSPAPSGPSPSEPAPSGPCNSDCESNPKGWGKKCGWNGCKGCAQCFE